MVKEYKTLLKNYFNQHSFVESNINSFDYFLGKQLQGLVDEVGEIVPTIIPQEVENFMIKLGKISVGTPEITEADGSRRDIFPTETRLRDLTYAAPITLEVSSVINGVTNENFTAYLGKMPIMLKSKHCHLHGLKADDLTKQGEDSNDSGGYFILNGNERALIMVEDLASNKFFVKKATIGTSKFVGKLYSEKTSYRIPHTLEQTKDGIISLSFTRFKRVPVVALIKALGIISDQEIMQSISKDTFDDVLINLYDNIELKTQEDALDYIAKKIGITQKEVRVERVREYLDKYLLPHLGIEKKDRIVKAQNLAKMVKRFLLVSTGKISSLDQDHYSNKRLKLSGDLLMDLFRVNLRSLVQDILYNFQRLVKRGKFTSLKIIIREQLLSSRVHSAMATGSWVGGRAGISQNMQRTNRIDTLSHLQRVVSLLTSSQENFDARALHSTHWGRLCPVETPEGTPIGLRKNLAIMANITRVEPTEEKIKSLLVGAGVKLA
jgi:DNA-directed RNA polymerase beta subunit